MESATEQTETEHIDELAAGDDKGERNQPGGRCTLRLPALSTAKYNKERTGLVAKLIEDLTSQDDAILVGFKYGAHHKPPDTYMPRRSPHQPPPPPRPPPPRPPP